MIYSKPNLEVYGVGLIIFIIAAYINGAGENIQEQQIKTHEFQTTNGGPGGNCEELANERPLFQNYLQPDDVAYGDYDDEMDSPREDHICTRTCRADEPPKICYYRFEVDRYVTMGVACKDCPRNQEDCREQQCIPADGYERMVIAVNRMMPGPSIQVCQNDLIVVDVKNKMPGTSITVHWHGITQQGTPYMDGVPMVTQCPIMEAQIFRYYFQPNNPGTFFWHSHSGLQKVDGFLGSLVVRRPVREDPNGKKYDFDYPSHVIVIQDWMHEVADALFPGLRRRRPGQHADTFLINGRGVFRRNGGKFANTPYAAFNIRMGFKYVFRIIAATCLSCPIRFQIEDHKLAIIGTDGRDTTPQYVDSIEMAAGERYNVIVRGKKRANLQKQHYWIHVTGTGICLDEDPIPSQQAILRYLDYPAGNQRPQQFTELDPGVVMGTANSRCDGTDGFCYIDLEGAEEAPIAIKQPNPDYRLIWGMDFHQYTTDEAFPDGVFRTMFNPTGESMMVGHINGIVHTPPPVPLLTQLSDVPRCMYCSTNQPYSQWYNIKECLHLFRVLDYPAVVEVVIVDIDRVNGNSRTKMTHPMHLHGYDQYLIAQGVFDNGSDIGTELENLLARLRNNRNIPDRPVMKDTYLVNSGGYIVYRIIADNPGFWIFHCHFAYHSETGMAGVLQVGNTGDHPDPPEEFPTCNNFLPQPKRNDEDDDD